MSKDEIIATLKELSPTELDDVIKAARRLGDNRDRVARRDRMKQAALAAVDDYKPGGEQTEWTLLDTEDFIDETEPG